MHKLLPMLLLPALIVLSGCEDESDFEREPEDISEAAPNWVGSEQVYHNGDRPQANPAEAPVKAASRFFSALDAGDVGAAAAEVAQRPLEMSEGELVQDIAQWAKTHGNSAGQGAFVALDSHSIGDFAIVSVEFPAPGQGFSPEVRPVVLFNEGGQWKIVWDLLGKQPEQVAAGTRERLEPLYDWYEDQQLRAGVEGDLPGQGSGIPMRDEPNYQPRS